MYLGSSTYRIHGTDAPWTIGQAVSKGCIRMFNEDVLDLYPRVPVGMKVTVTWNRFKTGGVETVSASGKSSGGDAFSGFFGYEGESRPAASPRKTVKSNSGKPMLYYVPNERRAEAD
jgi:hypothetical protein